MRNLILLCLLIGLSCQLDSLETQKYMIGDAASKQLRSYKTTDYGSSTSTSVSATDERYFMSVTEDGQIHLFFIDNILDDIVKVYTLMPTLEEQDVMTGVKFHPSYGSAAVANGVGGTVILLYVDYDQKTISQIYLKICSIPSNVDGYFLLDWNEEGTMIVVTGSNGGYCTLLYDHKHESLSVGSEGTIGSSDLRGIVNYMHNIFVILEQSDNTLSFCAIGGDYSLSSLSKVKLSLSVDSQVWQMSIFQNLILIANLNYLYLFNVDLGSDDFTNITLKNQKNIEGQNIFDLNNANNIFFTFDISSQGGYLISSITDGVNSYIGYTKMSQNDTCDLESEENCLMTQCKASVYSGQLKCILKTSANLLASTIASLVFILLIIY